MTTHASLELQRLMQYLSLDISRRLSGHLPEGAVQQMKTIACNEQFAREISGVRNDWLAHVGPQHASEKRDVLVSVLMAHLVGPLSRVDLPPNVDKEKARFAIINMFFAALENDSVSGRLIDIGERIMMVA